MILDRLAQAYVARTLTYPDLPYLSDPAGMAGCRYKALTAEIAADDLRRIRQNCRQEGTELFAVLLTLFGERPASLVLNFGGVAVFAFTLLPALLAGACEYGFRRIVDIH